MSEKPKTVTIQVVMSDALMDVLKDATQSEGCLGCPNSNEGETEVKKVSTQDFIVETDYGTFFVSEVANYHFFHGLTMFRNSDNDVVAQFRSDDILYILDCDSACEIEPASGEDDLLDDETESTEDE